MHTKATIHLHPTIADPCRIFEVRRLARECGCAFISIKTSKKRRPPAKCFDPNGGGHAA
ncbi:hypothetical protein PMI37_05317 [Pseudomonas sp. GM80]|nr:hypothetical protein PMI37_05317 [Pseudomonas sp. GM80]